MRNSFALLLCLCNVCLALLVSTACLPQTATPLPSINPPASKATSSGQLIELVTDDYPPFQYSENGNPTGLAVEITQTVFQRMGYSVAISIFPWARALDMVKKGEADGIFLIYKNPERAQLWLDYPSEPVLIDIQSLDTLTDSAINYQGDLTTLSQYNIGTIRDYDYGADFMAAIKNRTLHVEPASTNMNNLDKLLGGHIDIIADSWYVTRYNAKRHDANAKIKTLQPFIRQIPSYLAFSKKRNFDKDFIDRYSQILLEMKKDGSYDAIIQKYLQ